MILGLLKLGMTLEDAMSANMSDAEGWFDAMSEINKPGNNRKTCRVKRNKTRGKIEQGPELQLK